MLSAVQERFGSPALLSALPRCSWGRAPSAPLGYLVTRVLILTYFLAADERRRQGRAEERAAAAPREAQRCPRPQRAGARGEVPIPSPDKITFVPPWNLLPDQRAAETTPARWERAAQGHGADRRLCRGQPTHATGCGWRPELRGSRHGP